MLSLLLPSWGEFGNICSTRSPPPVQGLSDGGKGSHVCLRLEAPCHGSQVAAVKPWEGGKGGCWSLSSSTNSLRRQQNGSSAIGQGALMQQ